MVYEYKIVFSKLAPISSPSTDFICLTNSFSNSTARCCAGVGVVVVEGFVNAVVVDATAVVVFVVGNVDTGAGGVLKLNKPAAGVVADDDAVVVAAAAAGLPKPPRLANGLLLEAAEGLGTLADSCGRRTASLRRAFICSADAR